MRNQILIIGACLIVILAIAFVIFQSQGNNLSVNLGNYTTEKSLMALSFNINSSINSNPSDYSNLTVTKQEASDAINESQLIILDMLQDNFSIEYMNDSLIEAKRTFELARYAEILRNPNSSYLDNKEASQALRLMDWKKIDYTSVLRKTDEIKQRRIEALYFYDTINSILGVLQDYSSQGYDLNQSFADLENARDSFYADRYNDTLSYLEQTRMSFETSLEKHSTSNILGENVKTFIVRYKYQIIAIIIILAIIAWISYKKISRKMLKNKIIQLRAERQGLIELEKKNQEDRFKDNKISGLVYNIRMKKYQERLQEINQELPILEEKLDRKVR